LRRWVWVPLVCAGAVLAVAAWDEAHHAGRVHRGVWVEDVPVGGLDVDVARDLVLRRARAEERRLVVVRAGDHTWSKTAGALGLTVDAAEAVEAAYRVGREPNPVERVRQRLSLRHSAVRVPLRRSVDETELVNFLRTVSSAVRRPARDGRLEVSGGRVVVVPGEAGVELDPVARPVLRRVLVSGAREAVLPLRAVQPTWTAQRLEALGIREPVATFTTRFPRDPDRTHNIALAAARLRGLLLLPGQVLSFNRAVGPRTKVAGFREAPVLVDEELVPGDGGGVCQVSSTLFNAALLADLAVVSRANHTQPVAYLPVGRDATVVYGLLDLQVRNDGPPLLLWTEVSGDRVTASFWGPARPRRRVRLLVTDVQVLPPPEGEVVRTDPRLARGEVKVLPPRPGYRVTTVREVWEGGTRVRREVVARSLYRPVPRTVKVGTGDLASFPAPRP
jgi:vancomycin resistance protein YoaR